MREVCYCDRIGEIEGYASRSPRATAGRALRCPSEACGHPDRMGRLSGEARMRVFEQAEQGKTRRGTPAAA